MIRELFWKNHLFHTITIFSTYDVINDIGDFILLFWFLETMSLFQSLTMVRQSTKYSSHSMLSLQYMMSQMTSFSFFSPFYHQSTFSSFSKLFLPKDDNVCSCSKWSEKSFDKMFNLYHALFLIYNVFYDAICCILLVSLLIAVFGT